jgi:hypothetical protein
LTHLRQLRLHGIDSKDMNHVLEVKGLTVLKFRDATLEPEDIWNLVTNSPGLEIIYIDVLHKEDAYTGRSRPPRHLPHLRYLGIVTNYSEPSLIYDVLQFMQVPPECEFDLDHLYCDRSFSEVGPPGSCLAQKLLRGDAVTLRHVGSLPSPPQFHLP